MTGDDVVEVELAPCAGARWGEAHLEVDDGDWGGGVLVRSVRNCSARSVTVGRDGGEVVHLEPGATTEAFAGRTWTGTSVTSARVGWACPTLRTTRAATPTRWR